jgi:hypothetical protein
MKRKQVKTMTSDYVIKKLTIDLIKETGDFEHADIYKRYLTYALTIGMEHFDSRMQEIAAFKDNIEVGRYRDTSEASKKLNISQGNIKSILIGKRHQSKGYTFMKVKDHNLNIEI